MLSPVFVFINDIFQLIFFFALMKRAVSIAYLNLLNLFCFCRCCFYYSTSLCGENLFPSSAYYFLILMIAKRDKKKSTLMQTYSKIN